MEDVKDVLIENLRECLRLAQRYIVLSIGSALLLLVLIKGVPELLEAGAQFEVPGLGKVDPGWAAFIFMVACLVFGSMAAWTVNRAKNICSRLRDTNIVTAALTYPSVVTSGSRTLRIGSAAIAPALLVASYIVEHQRGGTPITIFTLIGLGVFCMPFIVLVFMVYHRLDHSKLINYRVRSTSAPDCRREAKLRRPS